MRKHINDRDVIRAVALPTAAALAVLAAIVGAVLLIATAETDDLALVSQRERVEIAVRQSQRKVSVDQQASTHWDDAVLQVRRRPLDLAWIDNNLGIWFHTYYKFDEAYVLDPTGTPIYAMRDGKRVAPAAFARLRGSVRKLARRLRKGAPASGALPIEGVADLTTISGRPALLSLKPIAPEHEELAPPGSPVSLHLAVRYLDRSFLDEIAATYAIDRPRFVSVATGPASIPLRDRDGATIGHLGWTAFEPGRTVRNHVLPVLLAALILTGMVIASLLSRLHRNRRDLERSRSYAQHQAWHDSLTGLPNRALFEQRLNAALDQGRAGVAVLMLDLDRFKNINDSLGHPAGDQLIRDFAGRLGTLIRHCDLIARLGGDEFAILVEDPVGTDVQALAARILESIRQPFRIAGVEVHAGVSIGVAIAPGGSERHELVREADIALYNAKENGRNICRTFEPEMERRVKSRIEIEQQLRDALSRDDELNLHYQPLVDAAGIVVGVEALLRWNHPQHGLVLPDRFIGIAEETGLIVPLGERVLKDAFAASLRWPDLFVAVNLSPMQFRSSRFLATFDRLRRESGVDPHRVQLEVTERILLEDDENVLRIIAGLRDEGFKIVLDDFGKGYSSLSYLRKFRVDKIKIDSSFIQNLEDAPDARAIVVAVLALARAMDLEVAAEGVETQEQRKFLRASGCRQMQGYLFAQAMGAPEIDRFLARAAKRSAAA